MPKPVQDPLPIWIGGTGKKTLRVAAKHADAVNFAWTHPPRFFEERFNVLRRHCEEVGRDFGEIRKSAGLMLRLVEDPDVPEPERDERYLRYLGKQNPVMVNTPEVVAEKIRAYIDVGVTHFILRFHYGDEIRNMRVFMESVAGRL